MADTIGRYGDGGRYWTEEEDQYLQRRIAEGASHSVIGRELGRGKNACVGRANLLRKRDGKPVDMRALVWTPELTATLMRMYAEFHTYPQIAAAIGKPETATKRKAAELLKNGTMAKRVRKPFPKGDPLDRLSRINSIEARNKARERAEESFSPAAFYNRTPVPHMAGRLVDALENRTCRYPVNDAAKGEDHLFCGTAAREKSSYCQVHHGVVWRTWTPAP